MSKFLMVQNSNGVYRVEILSDSDSWLPGEPIDHLFV
jgi:hypothetical protein